MAKFKTLEQQQAEIDRKNPGPHCRRCNYWFLGCLRGREKWEDESDSPNCRFEGADGKIYPYPTRDPVPKTALPLRMVCDGFEPDPDQERLGRAVWPR